MILARRNSLAFPGGGAGVNPGHVAVKRGGLRCSVVASGGGSVVTNLLNPKPLSSLVGPGVQVSSISSFGPVVDFPQGTTANLFVPGVAETPTGVTWALIFSIDASHSPGNNPVLMTNGGDVNQGFDALFFTKSTLFPSVLISGSVGSWSVAMPVNTPLFLAVSYTVSGAVSVGANVLVNLATGQIQSIADTGSPVALHANTTGLYGIGNGGGVSNPSTSFPSCSKIAAAAFIANYLSVNELLEWAQDPWSFWYPQAVRSVMGLALTGGAAGARPSSAAAILMGL